MSSMDTTDQKDQKQRDLVTLQNIAPSKLLNYVVKDQLRDLIGVQDYAQLEAQLRAELGRKAALKDIKQYLAQQEEFIAGLRQHDAGATAFGKYLKAVGRLRSFDRKRTQQVRKVMHGARKRYLGCLATKLQPEHYQECLDRYDSPDYDNIGLVPSRLRQRAYDYGDDQVKALLGPSVEGRRFNDLPSGLKTYISSHPSEFKNYYNQRRHELGLMKSVLRNLEPHEKEMLRAYYQRHKSIPRNMFDIRTPQSNDDEKKSRKRSKTGRYEQPLTADSLEYLTDDWGYTEEPVDDDDNSSVITLGFPMIIWRLKIQWLDATMSWNLWST